MPLKLIAAAAVGIVLLAGPSHAQVTGPIPNTGHDDGGFNWRAWPSDRQRTPEEAGREHEIERRYNETLKTRIPDRKPVNDPWRNMRQAPAAAAPDRHKPQ